jgi:outer membrane protein TolC
MKKKIICLALALSVLMTSNVFAVNTILPSGTKLSSGSAKIVTTTEGDADASSLTIEEAVAKAIANSSSLKTLDDNQELEETNFKNTSTSLTNYDSDDENGANSYLDLAVQYKRLATSIKNYDDSKEVTKQQLEQSIREYFIAIIEAENEIDLYEQNMAIQEQSIKIDETKLKLGLISQSEYDSAKNTYANLKSNRDTLENKLTSAYSNLNVILGTNTKERYNISYDCTYTREADTIVLASVISKAQSNSYSIKQKKNAVDIAKYDLEKYSLSTSSNYSSDTRDTKEATYNKATRDYGDAIDNIEVTITNWYNSLKENEQSYADNISTLELKKSQLSIYETKLELGTITDLELQKYKYEIASLENTVETLKYNHDLLVRKLNNPDLGLN